MILSGELEVLAAVPDDEDDMAVQTYDTFDDPEDDFGPPLAHPSDDLDDLRNPLAQNIAMLKSAVNNPFAHSLATAPHSGGPKHLAHLRPRTASQQQHQGPMIVSNPPTVSFENPAMASLFEPHPYGAGHFLPQQTMDSDKISAWNAQLYPQQQQLMQSQRTQFTPSLMNGSSPTAFVDQALFASFQPQQQQLTTLPLRSTGLYGADGDDSSSVGSGRGRSGSVSGGSGFGSPNHHGSPVSYELPGAQTEYGVPRKMAAAGLGVGAWGEESMGGMGMMKPGLGSPINVGGGGNGSGFAMMMM